MLDTPARKLQTAAMVMAVAILPLMLQPLRLEAHETYRAGVLALLILTGALAFGWRALRQQNRVLLLAVVAWVVALTLSSLFSLSPARSFGGDLIRRMGWWTQIALVGCVFWGARINPAAFWRWLWLAGVVVAAHVGLQAAGLLSNTPLEGRPPGLLGSATFTGGWLMLALLWATLALIGGGWRNLNLMRRVLVSIGLLVMVIALLLVGSRGAMFGLAAGALTALLFWLPTLKQSARTLLLVLFTALVILAGLMAASRYASRGGLFTRQDFHTILLSLSFRLELWEDALSIGHDWLTLSDVNGIDDRWAALRPVFGYGPEMFEAPHRVLFDDEIGVFVYQIRLDRAHNDWLDTLVTMGWPGVLARLSIWAAIWYTVLKRLGLNGFSGWLLPISAAAIGAALFSATPLLPLAATFGALMGMWLFLLGKALHRSALPLDLPAWIAIAAASAHLVDIQFSFESVATGIPFWLSVGLLFTPKMPPAESVGDQTESISTWAWAGVAGMFLLRTLTLLHIGWPAVAVVLSVIAGAALVVAGLPRTSLRTLAVMALLWILGATSALFQEPTVAALWDVFLLNVGLITLYGKVPRWTETRPMLRQQTVLLAGAVFILALFLWTRDSTADMLILRGRELSAQDDTSIQAVQDRVDAARLRPWDDRIAAVAGHEVLTASLRAPDGIDAGAFALAQALLNRAASLDGFNADHALQLAIVEANLALLTSEGEVHTARADSYFRAASSMWPFEVGVWREWGRFALEVDNNPQAAIERLEIAVRLDPSDAESPLLLARAAALASNAGN